MVWAECTGRTIYVDPDIPERESDNWGYGSKLSSPEYIRNERGPVIGERECVAAGIQWKMQM